MLHRIFATVLFLIVPFIQIQAHDHHHHIPGIYDVTGFDPLTGPYTGTAVITQNGDIYNGVWTFPDPSGPIVEINTGFIQDGVLTFVYVFEGTPGAISYEIPHHHGHLEGIWVSFEGTALGTESLKKISEVED